MKPNKIANNSEPFQGGGRKSNILEVARKLNISKLPQIFLPAVKSQLKFGTSAFPPQFSRQKSTNINIPKPSFHSTPIQTKAISTSIVCFNSVGNI